MGEAETAPGSGEAPDVEIIPAGTMIQGRYRIMRPLGVGGMGTVYEAENVVIEKRVALKCLHPALAAMEGVVARFRQEALSATKIGHENIIDVTDLGRLENGIVFMVMEFLPGEDFSIMIEREGPQPIGRTAHILAQVCAALGAAHAKGVVHRDLKPENLYITPRQRDPYFVKLLDFGISKFVDATDRLSNKLTKMGETLGTPWYMSPEQIQGLDTVDHRTDIYALGVILFNALTGRHPFEDDSFAKIAVDVCMKTPVEVGELRPEVPDALVQLCVRLLAKNPDERPQSCAEVADVLIPFIEHDGPIGSLPPSRLSTSLPPFPAHGLSQATPEPRAVSQTSGVQPVPASGPTQLGEKIKSQKRRSPIFFFGAAAAAALAIGIFMGLDDSPDSLPSPSSPTPQASAPAATTSPASTEPAAPPEVEDPEPAVPEPAESEPAATTIEIRVEPDGARIFEGRVLLGEAPLTLNLPTTGELNLVARRRGYESSRFTLSQALASSASEGLDIELKEERSRSSSRREEGASESRTPRPSRTEAPELMRVDRPIGRSGRDRSPEPRRGFMVGQPVNPWMR